MSLFSRLLRFHGSNVGFEDFFTEIFAHLLSTYPHLCLAWLTESGVLPVNARYSHINVTTQRPLGALETHGRSSRLDVVIELSEGFSDDAIDERSDEVPVPPTDIVFVESKVGSPEGEDHQLRRYAEASLDPSAWSGLDWAIDLREVLTAEDHMAAARTHFLRSLDDVSRMRKQYASLPRGSEV